MEKYWSISRWKKCSSCGLIQKENIFYMGSTGGGVWKSEDYGINWKIFQTGFSRLVQ